MAVCPWNKYAKKTNDIDFIPKKDLIEPTLKSFLSLDESMFRKQFSRSSIKRIGRNRFIRNVLIAVGNSKNKNYLSEITLLLSDSSDLVRSMAVWALKEILNKKDFELQKKIYYKKESDPKVKNEWIDSDNQIQITH